MKFKAQHIIITGCSSGIGKATAKLLVSEGANVSIIDRDRAKLESAKAELESVKVNPTQQILNKLLPYVSFKSNYTNRNY